MACVTLCARSHPVVEARHRTNSIVIKIGDALISLDTAEAARLGESLLAVAAPSCLETISGPITVTPDHANDSVVIAVAERTLLELSPSAWGLFAMQGSNAALALQGKARRTGLREAVLHRANALLAEVSAGVSA